MRVKPRDIRAVILFGLGAWGFHHEIITVNAERPTLVLACLALMGLEVFLRRDEKRNGK